MSNTTILLCAVNCVMSMYGSPGYQSSWLGWVPGVILGAAVLQANIDPLAALLVLMALLGLGFAMETAGFAFRWVRRTVMASALVVAASTVMPALAAAAALSVLELRRLRDFDDRSWFCVNLQVATCTLVVLAAVAIGE